MRLENRVAIVTGGARGIGEGISRCLADEGARIAVLDIDGEAAQEMASELGSDHLGMAVDISQEDTAAVAIDKVAESFGRVDILINNAGGGNRKTSNAYGPPFTRVEQEGWDEQMAINLRTTFAATKAALPHLKQRDQGSIVNISSVSGLDRKSVV